MKQRLFGIAFVALLTGALSLAVLSYQQAFTPVDWVTLHAGHTGMQLLPGADVKLRGVRVGEVREITADGKRATLRLALDPAQRPLIPADVTARLLPKTLFGERYVALIAGDSAAGTLQKGAVITEDRTETAIELERVLNDALPLLQSIKPDRLAAVLGALAYGLEGRGEQVGGDLVMLSEYLGELNEQLPVIAEDVQKLAEVLDLYHDVAPDLVDLLRDATVNMRTISEQRSQLADFLKHTTEMADHTRIFLDRHDARLIQLGQVSRPVLELLAAYAPEYPCLLAGITTLQPRAEAVFATGRMHITLEATRDQGKFEPDRDEPVYGARNGPNCRGLPDPHVPAPEVPINDGYDYSGPRGPLAGVEMGYAGTDTERAALQPILAAAIGVPAGQVSDTALLLWGPLLRGAVVNVT